jgi:hypothetical protein
VLTYVISDIVRVNQSQECCQYKNGCCRMYMTELVGTGSYKFGEEGMCMPKNF